MYGFKLAKLFRQAYIVYEGLNNRLSLIACCNVHGQLYWCYHLCSKTSPRNYTKILETLQHLSWEFSTSSATVGYQLMLFLVIQLCNSFGWGTKVRSHLKNSCLKSVKRCVFFTCLNPFIGPNFRSSPFVIFLLRMERYTLFTLCWINPFSRCQPSISPPSTMGCSECSCWNQRSAHHLSLMMSWPWTFLLRMLSFQIRRQLTGATSRNYRNTSSNITLSW